MSVSAEPEEGDIEQASARSPQVAATRPRRDETALPRTSTLLPMFVWLRLFVQAVLVALIGVVLVFGWLGKQSLETANKELQDQLLKVNDQLQVVDDGVESLTTRIVDANHFDAEAAQGLKAAGKFQTQLQQLNDALSAVRKEQNSLEQQNLKLRDLANKYFRVVPTSFTILVVNGEDTGWERNVPNVLSEVVSRELATAREVAKRAEITATMYVTNGDKVLRLLDTATGVDDTHKRGLPAARGSLDSLTSGAIRDLEQQWKPRGDDQRVILLAGTHTSLPESLPLFEGKHVDAILLSTDQIDPQKLVAWTNLCSSHGGVLSVIEARTQRNDESLLQELRDALRRMLQPTTILVQE